MTEKGLNTLQQRKRARILEVAGPLFLHDGYANVSMDAIAEAAPVSKATLYNHFADKKALFSAVISQRCEVFASVLEKELTGDQPEKALTEVARQFLKMILAPDSLRMHRTMIAGAMEFPELGKMFYESGPKRLSGLLAQYLQTMHEAKILDVPDAMLSTSFFLNSLKGKHHMECLLGVRDGITSQEEQDLIAYAVKMFLKAHRR